MSDARAQQAREHHLAAEASLGDASQHREQRDSLVRQLRRDDPARWSYGALARAVGCSPELIAVIVKRSPDNDETPAAPSGRDGVGG